MWCLCVVLLFGLWKLSMNKELLDKALIWNHVLGDEVIEEEEIFEEEEDGIVLFEMELEEEVEKVTIRITIE